MYYGYINNYIVTNPYHTEECAFEELGKIKGDIPSNLLGVIFLNETKNCIGINIKELKQ